MALIFVGNIDRRNTEANLRSVFEVYGPVATVDLKLGYAFVEMDDNGQAQKAISDLNSQGSWVLRTLAATA
jgi:RNA recognition motif-containing protein